jgi:signal transduction histidine kinase
MYGREAVDEDLTCSSLEWQISDAGGRIIEDDKTISVNNPRVIRAWQPAARWVGSISPPGVVLPISRSIIESHGGRLWATGACGRGATFQFTLPATESAHL